jgi:ribose transport system ATP-binding protein
VNTTNQQTLIEVKHIHKHFGATIALNDVSLSIPTGIIAGLIGENGSGKSTLSSIMSGILSPTQGEMLFKGNPWAPADVIEASKQGIGIVVQEAGTISGITVAQNIFLGNESLFSTLGFVNQRKMNLAAKVLLERLELDLDPNTRIEKLDSQSRKLVEIAKIMYWNPDVLIIDETSTSLSHTGREFLYKLMKRHKESGKSVIFISHDLDEMMAYCDELNVLRDGVLVGKLTKAEFSASTIRNMMVGRELKGQYYRNDFDPYGDNVVLKADQITTIKDLLVFSLELHQGEILGIGGLAHCGMHTVGKALFGIEKVLDGEVKLVANNKVIKNAKTAVKNRMGYVSKNRDTESLGLSASIYENIASTGFELNQGFKPLISNKKENQYVDKQIEDLKIKCASKHHMVSTLSGGNKQKVVFGKWIASDAQILILDSPTRGVDVGVKAAMYQLIYDMKKAGKSIILISEELQELIGMSDRILIMKDGEVTGEFKRSPELTEHVLIEYMV